MRSSCSKCGMHIESPWSFCPHCGASAKQAELIPREHQRVPVIGAFSGVLLGAAVAPVLIIVGCMLCLTGLGAFVGVPLILAGILAPIAGPLFGSTMVAGKCPWCGTSVSCMSHCSDFACPACDRRIAVNKHELIRAG